MTIQNQIEAVMNDVYQWRRTMHQNPELSFQEYWTSDYIAGELAKMDSIEISRPTETSVLGIIKGTQPGKKSGSALILTRCRLQKNGTTFRLSQKMTASCTHVATTGTPPFYSALQKYLPPIRTPLPAKYTLFFSMRRKNLPVVPVNSWQPGCSMISTSSTVSTCSPLFQPEKSASKWSHYGQRR